MCCGVRCTDKRIAFSWRIFERAGMARRSLWAFLFMTSLLLRFLQLDLLARIPHALALVRLRRTEVADVGGNLADLLHVRALDQDFRLGRRLDRDALGRGVDDRMREAERQVQVLALHRRAIADADELELALVTLADAEHDVREMRTDRARDHVGFAAVVRLLHFEHAAVLHDFGVLRVHGEIQRALAALHADAVRGDRRGHALRQSHWLFSYARHTESLLGNDADDFAAVTGSARLAIAHHTLRRRHDGDAEPA